MLKHCWKKCRKIAKGAEHFSFIIREQFANLCNSFCCERMQNLSTDSRPRCTKEIRIACYQTVGIFFVYNSIKQYVTRTISCRGCFNVSMVCFIRRRYLPGPGTATPFLKSYSCFSEGTSSIALPRKSAHWLVLTASCICRLIPLKISFF
jgi:hypothetical protein